jgi:Ser-tRNA(Ala) deacylase AlaX
VKNKPFLYSYSAIKSQGRWDILPCGRGFVNTLKAVSDIVTQGIKVMTNRNERFNSPCGSTHPAAG